MDRRNQTPRPDDSKTSKAMLPMAFLVPLIMATAYLNMGPTCCGSSCPDPSPISYPPHLAIDVPVVELNGRLNGEDPFFLTMEWEATSHNGSEPGNVRVEVTKKENPIEQRVAGRQGDHVLLGEDIGKAKFEFPEIGTSVSHARSRHIKLAGMTMCAFDRDDGNALETVAAEFSGFRDIVNEVLKDYAKYPFGDPAAEAVFGNLANRLFSEAEAIWNAMTPQQQADPPTKALHEEILAQVQGLIDLAETGVNSFTRPKECKDGTAVPRNESCPEGEEPDPKAIDPNAVLGFIGQAVELIPNIISLFRKRNRAPDYDDFAGCASVMYVGLPDDVFRDFNLGFTEGDCTGGEGGLGVAVCAIDQGMETRLRLDAPRDQKMRFDTRSWTADVQARRGTWTTTSSTEELRRAAHKYVTVASQTGEERFTVPDTEAAPVCNSSGKTSGSNQRCKLHFANLTSYQTAHAHALSFKIEEVERASAYPWEYHIQATDTGGNNNRANVGVRISTVTIPEYVRWKRVVMDLAAGPEGNHTEWIQSPSGYEDSPNLIVIPEILSLEEVDAQGSLNFWVREGAGVTELNLSGPGNFAQCLGYPFNVSNCRNTAKIRLTFLYWDDAGGEHRERIVKSTDNASTPPTLPAFTDLNWLIPSSQEFGATLYFPVEFWQAGSHNASFSLRATGTEVTKASTPVATLHASDMYFNEHAFVIGKILNFRFR